jgi:hypothetical protein
VLTFVIGLGLPIIFVLVALWSIPKSHTIFVASFAAVIGATILFWYVKPQVTTWYAGPLAATGYMSFAFPIAATTAFAVVGVLRRRKGWPTWVAFVAGVILSVIVLERNMWIS